MQRKIKHLGIIKNLICMVLLLILICDSVSYITKQQSASAKSLVIENQTEEIYMAGIATEFNKALSQDNSISVMRKTVDITSSSIEGIESENIIEAVPNNTEEQATEYKPMNMYNIEFVTQEAIIDDGTIAYAPIEVISPYEGYITKYMDLSCRMDISTDQMNYIIDWWLSHENVDSDLRGRGQAYIDASRASGYDPIFLLALSAQEGGWHISDLHSSKNNPYSINMVDSNPNAGYTLGDDYSEGIINGAIWIHENYYDKGYTTLYDMIHGGKRYASAADSWISAIVSIMDDSYKLIN